ncbi:MAG: phage major capsid protein [Planctomycetota bacterium]|jgi:hypothetical protein
MSDLTNATRELFVRSLVDEVYMRTPVVEMLQKKNKITYSGGKYIERLVTYDNMDDLWQEYTANQALTDQKKNMLDKPRFTWKYAQLPLRYGIDEYTQNIAGNDKDYKLLDLADFLVDKAHTATRLKLCSWMFNGGVTTGVADGATGFQSFVSALDHDIPYGTLTRSISAGTRDWWQGADPSGLMENVSSSTQGTATNITLSNLRKWIWESDIAHYVEGVDDLYICMCPTLYNKVRAEMESKMVYKPTGDTQRQGFNKMYLDGDGIQIASVPYLQKTSTTRTWVFILNLKYWELRIHNKRNFKMTGFKWQGDRANGHDYWLARIMTSGNFVCWKPNSSMWLSNVS